jgi:hypothetical protein
MRASDESISAKSIGKLRTRGTKPCAGGGGNGAPPNVLLDRGGDIVGTAP